MNIEPNDPLRQKSIMVKEFFEDTAKLLAAGKNDFEDYMRGQYNEFDIAFRSDIIDKFCQFQKAIPEFLDEKIIKDEERRKNSLAVTAYTNCQVSRIKFNAFTMRALRKA